MARAATSKSKKSEPKVKAFSAGIVPVYLPEDGSEPKFLILRCYNYWDFPKGGVQGNETPFAAAIRELEEETTLVDAELRWGDQFRDTPVYANGKVARYFVLQVRKIEVSLPINPHLGRAEHQEFRWCTFDQASRLLNARVLDILTWARSIVVSTDALT